MTDDPYRELEHYLQKAQDEIGIALKELENHQETSSYIFQTEDKHLNSYDGQLLDKTPIIPHPFFSNLNTSLKTPQGKHSPNTRRRLWKMHPSISFPETSKDLFEMFGQNDIRMFYIPYCKTVPKYRQRSNSDTSPEESVLYPRPPSGDVNLLSIWADKLVESLEKSLTAEENTYLKDENIPPKEILPNDLSIPLCPPTQFRDDTWNANSNLCSNDSEVKFFSLPHKKDTRAMNEVSKWMSEVIQKKKDAGTQTSPSLSSRSSSFTWVTDDYSEYCLSDDISSCSNFSINSNSSSSLYLSACSGSSDSFEESVEFVDSVNVQSDETIPISTLGDISEEQVRASDSNANESASFPSTLRGSRKHPTVLTINDLNLKSVSAPVLLRNQAFDSKIDESSGSSLQVPGRAHSAKELNELQALEACSWLRAAGFPQYAQMYEDNLFPVDVTIVQKDHAFLHPDSIQSLFRRLNTLNRCAKMKFKDPRASLLVEESDEDEQYALSENWEFQRTNRRWSRIASDRVTDNPPLIVRPEETYGRVDFSPGSSSSLTSEEQERKSLRRSGSDRVKEGAKALLKRMESLKGKRKKRILDANRIETSSGTDGSSSSSLTSSPQFRRSQTPLDVSQKDKECRFFLYSEHWNGKLSEKTLLSVTSPQDEMHANSQEKRASFYDNVCAPLVVFNDLYVESLGSPEKKDSSIEDIIILNNERRDSGVGSSLTRGITLQQAPWHCFSISSSTETKTSPTKISDLTAPQILLLRKFCLLKLTTIIEKYLPSSRSGWSWGKLICRIRNPDYKDKMIFGVPLHLIQQRTSQPLPVPIQTAIHHLRKTALDCSGLFRKSGVRSRIQKLKHLIESSPENVNYEEQQAYDIADMVKQYFRELPEVLLTNKLSEIFISIFQFVPTELRLEAVQTAVMLMPDENRLVLQFLLEFLREVCKQSAINQMSATNIAVCFAPSLFHLSSPPSSPRRRKTVAVPDLKEFNENRAAYECLACMITNYDTLFTVSDGIISQDRLSSASFSQAITLDELHSFVSPDGQSGVKGYIDSCIKMFLKESKEKYKGWKNVLQNDHVDLSSKKLTDGHPLKLWKVSTEIEAPPVELLNRILRERYLWDSSFCKGKLVSRLNKQTELIEYSSLSFPPRPPCDFCILRSWKSDLPKGACILIETSIDVPPSTVKGLILCSRYLIEPCGSGKSRITHISRIDSRGLSAEWYSRTYGHLCTLLLIKLRNSFPRYRAEGPETKV